METTSMLKLNYLLPYEFVRINWVSKQAERTWDPTISKLANFFIELERLALICGDKGAIIQSVRPKDFIDVSSRWLKDDLVVLPLEQVADSNTYQSSSMPLEVGKPWQYRVLIATKHNAKVYLADNNKIGELLGYPACCRKFFQRYWVEDRWIDTTSCMIGVEDKIEPVNNILLRWLGLRFVSHLPCSFTCEKTRQIGEANYKLACEAGHEREASQLKEILSWPIEWSSLHGIAIITTPYFKLAVRTDSLPVKKVIKFAGSVKQDLWTANGFRDLKSMDDAHSSIIESIKYLQPTSVIDFGSGNGQLLQKIEQLFGARVVGVDNDPAKKPSVCCDIYDYDFADEKFDLALISRNRIKENPIGWEFLRYRIERHCTYLCIYSYDDQPRIEIKKVK